VLGAPLSPPQQGIHLVNDRICCLRVSGSPFWEDVIGPILETVGELARYVDALLLRWEASCHFPPFSCRTDASGARESP
jgi:hypothetical protein